MTTFNNPVFLLDPDGELHRAEDITRVWANKENQNVVVSTSHVRIHFYPDKEDGPTITLGSGTSLLQAMGDAAEDRRPVVITWNPGTGKFGYYPIVPGV